MTIFAFLFPGDILFAVNRHLAIDSLQSFELTAMKRFFEAKTTVELILVRCPEDQRPNWGLLYGANPAIVNMCGSRVGRSLPV